MLSRVLTLSCTVTVSGTSMELRLQEEAVMQRATLALKT
jgi:hypothetical protein